MRALVTGAAGLTGSSVAQMLVEGGWDVIGVTRQEESRWRLPAGCEVAVADVRDAGAMRPLVARVDALVHVAGITLGTAVAAWSGLERPDRMVVVSSAGVYSEHRPSAATYLAGESAIRAVRADAVFVRPTMIYGAIRDRNVHHVIRFARRWRFLPIFGEGKALLQPLHYKDLAAVLAALASRDVRGILDIGGGAPLTVRDAARTILEALGLPERLVRLPLGPALLAARAVEAVRGGRFAERLERLSEDRSVDNARVVALTGVSPRDFRTGVRQQVSVSDDG